MPGARLKFRRNFRRGKVTLAKKVQRLTRKVNGRRPELKRKDTRLTPASFTSLGYADCVLVNNIAQGNDSYQRDGNWITPKYIKFNAIVDQNATAAERQSVRLMLIRVKGDVTSATINASYLLEDDSFIDSPIKFDNRKNLDVLMDRMVTLDPANSGRKVIKFNAKIPPSKTMGWHSSSGLDVTDNAIYLVTYCSAGTYPAYAYSLHHVLYYTDS